MEKEIDIKKFTSDELDKHQLKSLIEERNSFIVVAVRDIPSVVNRIEGEIEKQNFSCRVYTEYRSAAIAGMAVPTGITQVAGLAAAVGIGVHNLFTLNPDYEIGKNQVNNTVTVLYKKG